MKRLLWFAASLVGLIALAVGGLFLAAPTVRLYYSTKADIETRLYFSDIDNELEGLIFSTEEVVAGFERTGVVTSANDNSGRLFVVELSGSVYIVQDGERQAEPFLALPSERLYNDGQPVGYGENGLLDLAFHADFAENGRFFISYVNADNRLAISELRVDEEDTNRADLATEQVLLTVPRPANAHLHYGGALIADENGHLYIGVGDASGQGDHQTDAQDPNTLSGSILRIDVERPATDEALYAIPAENPFVDSLAGAPEVWAYGVRNPWRMALSPDGRQIYVTDVGAGKWEEINILDTDEEGHNLGWAFYEGPNRYERSYPSEVRAATFYSNEAPENLVFPVGGYEHLGGNCAVIGGAFVTLPTRQSQESSFLYGDYCSGRIWLMWPHDGEWQQEIVLDSEVRMTSMSRGEDGRIYMTDLGGKLHRLVIEETS